MINRKKITPVPTNEWCVKKDYSIAKHEGMPKVLKTKNRNENVCFDSHGTAVIDCHYEREVSSGEKSEGNKE